MSLSQRPYLTARIVTVAQELQEEVRARITTPDVTTFLLQSKTAIDARDDRHSSSFSCSSFFHNSKYFSKNRKI